MYKEIEGDLIKLALKGEFDAIAHGCNCFCRMQRGIALQMAAAFNCNEYRLEQISKRGDINKLGQIEYELKLATGGTFRDPPGYKSFAVVNCYTQYFWESSTKPLNYAALKLCLLKLNHEFKGKHIAIPQIGCGLAGGEWDKVRHMIMHTFKDSDVTVVIYKPTK